MASENSTDTRKRNRDYVDNGVSPKRSNRISEGGVENMLRLKFLIPTNNTATVIGKGGETITELQKDCGAVIKISKNNDFYPGTNDRICSVSGDYSNVLNAFCSMMDIIIERDRGETMSKGGNFNIKLIVCNSTASSIIGKGGECIKQMIDEFGKQFFIQVSPKSSDLTERIVSISGKNAHVKTAIGTILNKIQDDPQGSNYSHISYSNIRGPVPNADVKSNSSFSNSDHMNFNNGYNFNDTRSGIISNQASHSNMYMDMYTVNQRPYPLQTNEEQVVIMSVMDALNDLKSSLPHSSLSDKAVAEMNLATDILIKYGQLGFGFIGNSGNMGLTGSSYVNDNSPFSNIMNTSLSFTPQSTNMFDYGNNSIDSDIKEDIHVTDNQAAAIIGHGGKDIMEIKRSSCAQVEISKKGVYAPGTNMRIVTVTGTSKSVDLARKLIMRRAEREKEGNRITKDDM